jgi:hypothetical protein
MTEFTSTFQSVPAFNSAADAERSLTVILMYSILWIVGLASICACSVRQRWKRASGSSPEALLGKKKANACKEKSSREEIRQFLTDYVNEAFPSVFQSKSVFGRLSAEVVKHHRYLVVMSPAGQLSDERRMLTGVQLLTVQSMLMFMLAVLYEIQVAFMRSACFSFPHSLFTILSVVPQ